MPTAASSSRRERSRASLDQAAADRAVRRPFTAPPSPVVVLIGLFLASVVVHALIGTQQLLPDLSPDEFEYAKSSQSFAHGGGLVFQGVSTGYPPLWPVVLSLVWHFGSAVTGYQLAKVLGAVLASTVVIPVWLLGRELVGPRLALVPAGLCVTGAWMITTTLVLSENLAYPLAVASLACTVMAVRDTRGRWVLASLAFAVPAVLSRTQLLVLPVILALALALDVARQPPGTRRARIRARSRTLQAVLAVGVVGLLAALVVSPDLTSYAILANHVSLWRAVVAIGQHALSAINLFAFLPIAAAAALMARQANWRDDAAGPVLVTLTAAVLVLLPVLGRYEAYASRVPVDRYGMYLGPLLFLALVLAPGRIGKRAATGSALAVALVMAWTPLVKNFLEQPALYGTQRRIDALGLFGGHLWIGFVVVALVVTGAGLAALMWRRRGLGLAGATALVAVVLVTQAWTSEAAEIARVKEVRHTRAPPQLNWVDAHAHGPVSTLQLSEPLAPIHPFDVYTEFFNQRLDREFAVVPGPYRCTISLISGGELVQKGGPTCVPWPRYLVIQRGRVYPTLAGQRVLATTPLAGTLVQIPAGPPRVFGIVQPPCQLNFCIGVLGVTLFLPSAGELEITFGAAPTTHEVALAGHRWYLPARRETTLRVTVGAGASKLAFGVDWSSPAGAPPIASIAVASAGTTTKLLY